MKYSFESLVHKMQSSKYAHVSDELIIKCICELCPILVRIDKVAFIKVYLTFSSILFLQAALEKEKNLESTTAEDSTKQEVHVNDSGHKSESVKSLTSQMNELAVSGNPSIVTPLSDSVEGSDPAGAGQDIDKRIRALKKKVRNPALLLSFL